MNRVEAAGSRRSNVREPMILRYPLPYTQDQPPPPLVPQQPAELQYGNPYSEQETRGGYTLLFFSTLLFIYYEFLKVSKVNKLLDYLKNVARL